MEKRALSGLQLVCLTISILATFYLFSDIFRTDGKASEFSLFKILIWSWVGAAIGYTVLRAGLAVVKPFFLASAGLSIVILLAQSYCAKEVIQTTLSNASIVGLLILGLCYIFYRFLVDTYLQVKVFTTKGEGKWHLKDFLELTLLVVFIVLLIIMFFEVLTPIIKGLCIYKFGG